jgi:hypothetical protein
MYGGPGKGFFRIAKDPWEARSIINSGRLAVILGIEVSRPFGCTMKADVPQCDAADITRQLDEVFALGVRQMELTNKFDNALTGVAGDTGALGPLINAANFLETTSFWDMEHCEPADGESHDNDQIALPETPLSQVQDGLFGAIAQLSPALALPNIAVPVYGPPHHCNARGLTSLGEFTIREMAKRSMLFDPDHMSVKGRNASLDVIESIGYSGVISSHSWSTPDAYPRILKAGGFIGPYAGDSSDTDTSEAHQGGFVTKWRKHREWADPRYYFGLGFGSDINGLGAQGNPRGADVANPVTYPFTGLGGVTVRKQVSGERVYDINVDGVSHYGLYPDWIEDLRKVAGADGDKIVADMARGAEAYLQTWERAYGIEPDSCRNPDRQASVTAALGQVTPGMTSRQVLATLGQPYSRLGDQFGYCLLGTTGTVSFGADGRVSTVASGERPATATRSWRKVEVNCQPGKVRNGFRATRLPGGRGLRSVRGRASNRLYCRGAGQLSFSFNGRQLQIVHGRWRAGGTAVVRIDGRRVGVLRMRGPAKAPRWVTRSFTLPRDGRHRVTITMSGQGALDLVRYRS